MMKMYLKMSSAKLAAILSSGGGGDEIMKTMLLEWEIANERQHGGGW